MKQKWVHYHFFSLICLHLNLVYCLHILIVVKQLDKIYLSTPTKIAILDHEKKRTFVIRKDGLPDAGEIYFVHLLFYWYPCYYVYGAWFLLYLSNVSVDTLKHINKYNSYLHGQNLKIKLYHVFDCYLIVEELLCLFSWA